MKILSLLTLACASAALAACGPAPKPPSTDHDPVILQGFKSVEVANLKARLKDPESAVITGAFMSDNASGTPAYCGWVNARNGFGGMTGPQRFIASAVVGLESDFAPGEMDKSWAQLCSRPIAEQ